MIALDKQSSPPSPHAGVVVDAAAAAERDRRLMAMIVKDASAKLVEHEVERARKQAKIAETHAEIAQVDAEIAERAAKIAEREAQIAERDAEIAERKAQIAEREAQIAMIQAVIDKQTRQIKAAYDVATLGANILKAVRKNLLRQQKPREAARLDAALGTTLLPAVRRLVGNSRNKCFVLFMCGCV